MSTGRSLPTQPARQGSAAAATAGGARTGGGMQLPPPRPKMMMNSIISPPPPLVAPTLNAAQSSPPTSFPLTRTSSNAASRSPRQSALLPPPPPLLIVPSETTSSSHVVDMCIPPPPPPLSPPSEPITSSPKPTTAAPQPPLPPPLQQNPAHQPSPPQQPQPTQQQPQMTPVPLETGPVESLLSIVRRQDQRAYDALIDQLRETTELKKKISAMSKSNFQLESDISALDKKIALLIKNRISLEEAQQAKQEIMVSKDGVSKKMTLGKSDAEMYGRLFYLLQRDTSYIARLARVMKLGDMDGFLQTVMFTLFANQFEEEEENLLLTMFRTVLREDFKEARSIADALRSNTPLTRMMNTYTRRSPGQQYLKTALTEFLTKITKTEECLEVNPVKVFEQWVIDLEAGQGKAYTGDRKPMPEAAAAMPEIQAIIAPRMDRLLQLVSELVDCLVGSLQSAPYGIRWICRMIKQLCQERWPEATHAQVCSVVGGFFILRYVNPAVATPTAYMLVDAKLSNNIRRNLTLIAKIQQNLANGIQFGDKEFYMAPLNRIFETCLPKLNTFLDRLTEVDDLDVHSSLDQYIALTKLTEQTISTTQNEISFIHNLLVQHKETVITEQGDEVDNILKNLPVAPPQVPRKDNASIELKLVSSKIRNAGPDSTLNKMKPEQLYGETKYRFFNLMRTIPADAELSDVDVRTMLGQLASWAAMNQHMEILDEISSIVASCKKLVSLGALREEDNYGRLRKDLADEVTNIAVKTQRVAQDLERLKGVLQALTDRHEFGIQQLKVYEEYLANVRTTASSTARKAGSSTKTKSKTTVLKLSYSQLEKDGIISESQIPEDRRANINFQITMPVPGQFDVAVSYRIKEISVLKIQLDELLEKQANNDNRLDHEFIVLNVNLLIFLLNKTFL